MSHIFTSIWHSRWVRVSLVVVGVLVLAGYTCYRGGWYPLVSVNGTMVWAYEYRTSVQLTNNFYANVQKQSKMRVPQSDEIEKIVFDGLVDDIFITQELRTQMSTDEINQKIKTQVDAMIASGDGRTQMLALTQMSEKDSRTYLLNQIARSQMLADLFILQQKEILPWLMEQRNRAQVSFLGMRGIWNGEKGYEKLQK